MIESTQPVEPIKKKRRVNSKAKGSGFEGHISKVLAEKLSPMKFRRSQSSGAILGGENVKFMEQFSDDAKALFVGDVVPTNESDVLRDEGWKFKYTLECKFYKTADNLDHLFSNTRIKGWFEQATRDAEKIKKEPLLIFKFNRTETFCASTCEVPSTLSRCMNLKFDDVLTINVFLLSEALQDLAWWKLLP